MAKKKISFKNTIGADAGVDLEQNNESKGKVVWNKSGQKEHAIFGKPEEKTLTYENDGQEHKIIHTGNIDQYLRNDVAFKKDFTFPSTIWETTHDKGKILSIELQDTAGQKIRGQVVINDGIKIRVEYNIPVCGTLIGN